MDIPLIRAGRTRKVALMGVLSALAITLSFFDALFAGLFALPPGIRPGISNTVILFTVAAFGGREAAAIAVVKAMFALFTRGAMAGVLSFSGGLLSLATVWFLVRTRRISVSYGGISAAGGVAHNIGQLAVAELIIQNYYLVYYLPILILAGVLSGLLTGTVYRAAQPYLKRLPYKRKDPDNKRH